MPDGEKIVEFCGVGYEIGSAKILKDLDFSIEAGEILILLGESGCGKTTTLKLINRLIEPRQGSVLVNGVSTLDQDREVLRRKIGYVLQEGGLFPHMTIAENVEIVPKLENVGREKRRERSTQLLDLVGLGAAKFAQRFPHELSGGQRQRVGVARALAADPKLLLLDEPFGALDAITRTGLQTEFASLVKELNKTAVFVTHDLHEAMLLGTRIALMDKGQIVFLDTPDRFAASEIPLAKQYLETIR